MKVVSCHRNDGFFVRVLYLVICVCYFNWYLNVGDGVIGGLDCFCGVNVFMLVLIDLLYLLF